MRLARRLERVVPSPTFAAAARVAARRAAGHEVVGLTAGEPDFDTPEYIKAAAVRALAAGCGKYTPVGGTDALKDAVREKLRRDNSLDYGRDEVMASCGGKHALFTAFQALFDPGDEVVVPAPYWVSYPDMLRLAGAEVKVVETSAADGFILRPRALEAALGPRTRALILNSPCNPTGAVYGEADLEALGRIAERAGLIVISDDVYEHLVDMPVRHLGVLVPELRPRLVVVNSLSKTYAMTGWRLGYTAGPRELIRAMSTLQSQSTSNPTAIAQAAAVAALTGPQDDVRRMAAEFAARREYVCARLAAIPRLRTPEPRGAFYVFPDVSAYFGRRWAGGTISSADDLAGYLLEEADLGVVPGEGFGAPCNIRLSYAAGQDTLARGLDRLESALARLA